MPEKAPDNAADPLPTGLAKPAVRALRAAGYTRLSQLAGVLDEELLALHGMGPNALQKIKAALAAAPRRVAKRKRST